VSACASSQSVSVVGRRHSPARHVKPAGHFPLAGQAKGALDTGSVVQPTFGTQVYADGHV